MDEHSYSYCDISWNLVSSLEYHRFTTKNHVVHIHGLSNLSLQKIVSLVEYRHSLFYPQHFYYTNKWNIFECAMWGECHRSSCMISEYWFRLWIGAVRQHAAITWDLRCNMASLSHNGSEVIPDLVCGVSITCSLITMLITLISIKL